jgi:cytochrome c nitrite reductase small subunit
MGKLRDFWDLIKPQGGWKFPAIIISGAFVGIFIYTFITSRAYTYLSDDPATCVNCHVMAPYYATWLHSSHGKDATCNDCHIPQDNYFNKYFVKGLNGYRHAAVFTKRTEEQAMTAIPMNSQALMNNCIRCHTQLNSEFVETGRHTWKEMQEIGGSVCWDCHRDVPHTLSRSLSSTPDARVPMPESNVPEWLHKITSGK